MEIIVTIALVNHNVCSANMVIQLLMKEIVLSVFQLVVDVGKMI